MFKMMNIIDAEKERFSSVCESKLKQFSCVLGMKPSLANCYLRDINEVNSILEMLANHSMKAKPSYSSSDLIGLVK